MIMCNACFRDDKIKTSTTFTVEYKGCIIVVRNVPCLECPICGETTFADEVSERLEKIVNSAAQSPITSVMGSPMQAFGCWICSF